MGPGGFPAGGPGGGQMPGGGGASGSTARPMWVPATITYHGRTWTKVGVRFKGNSSLRSAWGTNTDKLPFKLDFNEFGSTDPELKDQRFHGFKQLSLSTNWSDPTAMRDAISYDILQDAGLPAAETAFYEVVLDHGAGPASLGVYTAIEVVDDTVIKRHFGEDKGNIFEGDGGASNLAEGVRERLSTSFPKENNDDTGWGDVERLYDALHAPIRKTDAAAWRKGLEAVFAVDDFLAWLAIAAALQHWDTYGGMTHNFYLYTNPANGLVTWISWDHNLVLGAMGGGGAPGGGQMPGGGFPGGAFPPPPDGAPVVLPSGFVPPSPGVVPSGAPGGQGVRPAGGGGMGRNASLGKEEVAATWPLIRFLMDDPVYRATYIKDLDATVKGPFEPTKMEARYARLAALLAPYAAKSADGAGYTAAVEALVQTTRTRVKAVNDFVANPNATPSPTPTAAPTP